MKRREFMASTSLALLSTACGTSELKWPGRGRPPLRDPGIQYIRPTIPPLTVTPYRGRHYRATVPDTLDLAERARIAVEGVLTQGCDLEYDCEIYMQTQYYWRPPVMYHSFHDYNGGQAKYLESLALLRQIAGTDVNVHIDQRMLETAHKMIGEDGLSYMAVRGRPWALFDDWNSILRPPNLPPAEIEQIFSLWPNGRAMLALAAWHAREPENTITRELMLRSALGVASIGVEKRDLIYFPCELVYRTPGEILAAGGTFAGEASPPRPLKEALATAAAEPFNMAPAACCDAGTTMQGLARVLQLTGDERVAELAGKLSNYVRQPYLPDGEFDRRHGHIHSNLFAVTGLLDYAMVIGDNELKELARRVYEFARTESVPELGFYPDGAFQHGVNIVCSDSCCVADPIILAVKLSEYGVGDYWEDVDRSVRNHFAEAQRIGTDWPDQIVDLPEAAGKTERYLGGYDPRDLPHLTGTPSFMVRERVHERMRGCFASFASINDWYPGWAGHVHLRMGVSGCCTGNGTRAIFYAWRGILTHRGDTLRVNLLLNRSSIWADVDSHLPYAGRIDIHVKRPVRLLVRIPEWVDQPAIRILINGQARTFGWEGRYVDVGRVKSKDKVALTFPIEERTFTLNPPFGEHPRVTVVLRGNDVVEMRPQGLNLPFYQRERYRSGQTAWKQVRRFEPAEFFIG